MHFSEFHTLNVRFESNSMLPYARNLLLFGSSHVSTSYHLPVPFWNFSCIDELPFVFLFEHYSFNPFFCVNIRVHFQYHRVLKLTTLSNQIHHGI
jgi:hypothetical protein